MTPSGIEPATFRFVVQNLKHCATAVPEVRSDDDKPEVSKSPNGLNFLRSSQKYQLCASEGTSTALSSTPCDVLSRYSPFYHRTDHVIIISQKAFISRDNCGAEDSRWRVTL
jgi:hypothetical protein